MKEKNKKRLNLLVHLIISIILIISFNSDYNNIKDELNSPLKLSRTSAFISISLSFIITLLFNTLTIYKIIFRNKSNNLKTEKLDHIIAIILITLYLVNSFVSELY